MGCRFGRWKASIDERARRRLSRAGAVRARGVMAIGYAGDPDSLPLESHREAERQPRQRRPLGDFRVRRDWGRILGTRSLAQAQQDRQRLFRLSSGPRAFRQGQHARQRLPRPPTGRFET